jgi:SAM-dependent methyltransferase
MNTARTVEFYDRYVAAYFQEWKNNDLLLPLLRLLVARSGAEHRVLDLGCGPGVESRRLVDLGANVVGVDLSEPSLEIARGHVPEATFIRMDAMDLTFPTESFDAILESAVLFHFTDEEQTRILTRLRQILRSGGVLLSIYMTGDYCGMQERTVDGGSAERFVNLKPIESWIDTVHSTGFALIEQPEFAAGPFRAALFSR